MPHCMLLETCFYSLIIQSYMPMSDYYLPAIHRKCSRIVDHTLPTTANHDVSYQTLRTIRLHVSWNLVQSSPILSFSFSHVIPNLESYVAMIAKVCTTNYIHKCNSKDIKLRPKLALVLHPIRILNNNSALKCISMLCHRSPPGFLTHNSVLSSFQNSLHRNLFCVSHHRPTSESVCIPIPLRWS